MHSYLSNIGYDEVFGCRMMALRVLQKQKHAHHTNIQSKAIKQETQTKNCKQLFATGSDNNLLRRILFSYFTFLVIPLIPDKKITASELI